MVNLTHLQMQTLVVISGRGKENPITGKEIAKAVNLRARATGKDGADMRSIINALRTKGFPICADTNGYWYAKTSEELSAAIVKFQNRIDKEQQACDGLKKAFDQIGKDPRDTFNLPKPWRCPRCQTDNSSHQQECSLCYLDRREIKSATTNQSTLV